MFDDVSGRYDFLNRVMTLGQDAAWREAMWRQVPASAHRVLDLCTGSGVSLSGLRRPGRTVLGIDVSLAMLRVAAGELSERGWAPRLACADGFHLPLRASALDAVTVAFGIRNLRPRRDALAEIARVLVAGGRLVVLEAAAPAPGPFAPFTRAWIRHAIPLFGRLSPDPTAYRYLASSIFEFGSGPEFEADLAAAGFRVVVARSFLLGAARLWVAERGPAVGQKPTEGPTSVQPAMPRSGESAQSLPEANDPSAEAVDVAARAGDHVHGARRSTRLGACRLVQPARATTVIPTAAARGLGAPGGWVGRVRDAQPGSVARVVGRSRAGESARAERGTSVATLRWLFTQSTGRTHAWT